jgi:hypothetical protein
MPYPQRDVHVYQHAVADSASPPVDASNKDLISAAAIAGSD